MWLLDRLWPAAPAPHDPVPVLPADPLPRRYLRLRPPRAGRSGIAPWQKVAAPPRRSRTH